MSAEPVKFVWYPKGCRWPWYPRMTGHVTYPDEWNLSDGDVSLNMTAVGPFVRSRVGLRDWVKHLGSAPERNHQ